MDWREHGKCKVEHSPVSILDYENRLESDSNQTPRIRKIARQVLFHSVSKSNYSIQRRDYPFFVRSLITNDDTIWREGPYMTTRSLITNEGEGTHMTTRWDSKPT